MAEKIKKATSSPEAKPLTFADILTAVQGNKSLLDDEGKDLLKNYQRLRSAKPTVHNTREQYRYEKLIFNWYYHITGLDEKIFFTAPDVLNYLRDENYKIEKTYFYNKFISGVKKQKDGEMLKHDIDSRIKELGIVKRDFSEPDAGGVQKLMWETKIAEQKFKDMEFEAKIKEGQYVLKSEVEQLLAARAAFLKDNLGAGFIHSRAVKIAEIIQGNTEHIPELIEFWMQHISEVFDYYAKPMRFEVPTALLNEEEESHVS